MRRYVPDLPRAAWVVLGGDALSAVGSGMTLPFFVVYLHRVRGLDLGLATLALTTVGLTTFAGTVVGGWLADRVGARRSLISGLVLWSAGTAWFAYVHGAATAIAAAVVIGLGMSICWPSLDTMLACVVEPEQLSSVFAVRHATLNVGLGVGALIAAAIVDVGSPGTFQLVYLVDAATCLAFVPVLLALSGTGAPVQTGERETAGYGTVLRDRTLVAVCGLAALIIAAGVAQSTASFAVYAIDTGGISSHALLLAFAVNTFGVAVLQLPVLRLLVGRRRTTSLVLACLCFGLAWCITVAAGHSGGSASRASVFALAMGVVAAGETLLSPSLSPIVNDLAPENMRGRYNGLLVVGFTTGFTVGPLLAGQGLRIGDGTSFFLILAVACAAAALGAASLRRRLDPVVDLVRAPRVEPAALAAEVA